VNNRLARSVSDWRWYLRDAGAAMGIRAVDYIAMSMSSGQAHGPDEQQLAAARRHARIEAALRSMPSSQIALIRLACEEETRTLRLAFGAIGNLAHLTKAALRGHTASQSKRSVEAWVDKLALKIARQTARGADYTRCDEIARGCDDVLEPARLAYVRGLGGVP
jgi:hypothetical protein